MISEYVYQDPLENHFDMQRARGGRRDNQSFQESLNNAVT